VIALVATTTATVVACSGSGSAPVSLPRVSTDSPSPTAHPSGHPTAATPSPSPHTVKQAALGVVRRYYQVFNSLHRSMDAAALAALLTPTCPCQAQVEAIRRAAARGEHYVDRASINVMRPSIQDARHAFVLVNLDTGRGGLMTANGRHLTSAPPRHGVQRVFRLVRQGRRWSIAAIEAG
jgi:hypothetical protein